MIGFKHLKISLFAYRPTRKLAYFSYNYPAPLSTKNLPLRPLTKSLFFKLHGAIFALININPCLPVFIIKIRLIQAVMAAPAFFAQEGSFEFHLSGNYHIGGFVRQAQFMHIRRPQHGQMVVS